MIPIEKDHTTSNSNQLWRLGEMTGSEQFNSSAMQVRKYGIAGIAIHLAGFVIGFLSIGL
jgi:hypothetical protein